MGHHKIYTLLHQAVRKDELDDVRKLCTPENVNDTAVDELHFTPLHCAALKGAKLEIVSHLLSMGCNINAKDADGDSALFTAALTGHQQLVGFLLLQGAEVDSSLLKSSTALLEKKGLEEKKYLEILKILQNPDAFKQQSTYSWQRPLANNNSIKQRIPHNNIINIEMISLK